MEKRSIKKRVLKGKQSHRELLASRIKALRGELTQDRFAQALGAGQSQVVQWEKKDGREKPTADKLLKMAARFARTEEEQDWLLSEAGIDFETLSSFVRERNRRKTEPVDTSLMATLEVWDDFELDEKGIPAPTVAAGDELKISARLLTSIASTICYRAPKRIEMVGALPFPLALNDLVIIDRSARNLPDLLKDGIREARLAAVLFRKMPEHLVPGNPADQTAQYDPVWYERLQRLQQKHNPQAYEGQKKSALALWSKIERDMALPIILFGRIEKQRAFEEADNQNSPARLVLSLSSGNVVPLSDLAKDGKPEITRDLLNEARIFGTVVGWIESPSHREGNLQ